MIHVLCLQRFKEVLGANIATPTCRISLPFLPKKNALFRIVSMKTKGLLVGSR